jgi:hypothetical protein
LTSYWFTTKHGVHDPNPHSSQHSHPPYRPSAFSVAQFISSGFTSKLRPAALSASAHLLYALSPQFLATSDGVTHLLRKAGGTDREVALLVPFKSTPCSKRYGTASKLPAPAATWRRFHPRRSCLSFRLGSSCCLQSSFNVPIFPKQTAQKIGVQCKLCVREWTDAFIWIRLLMSAAVPKVATRWRTFHPSLSWPLKLEKEFDARISRNSVCGTFACPVYPKRKKADVKPCSPMTSTSAPLCRSNLAI